MQIVRLLLILIFCFLSKPKLFSQNLHQNISGKIINSVNELPIARANITIINSSPTLGASSDKDGNFKIEKVPVGRYTILIQHIAFQQKQLFDIVVISAKETYLVASLTPQSQLVETVNISATYEPVNSLSVHSFTSEEINRYAATFNDPARLSTSLAGATTLNDQSNHIVVHGNSPNANAWYLNGLSIANPNHLSNAGTFSDQPSSSGGGVNVLSSQLLSTSNFYKNNYPLHFSNALGGIYDMHFRTGNKQENNYSIQAGAIGLEASTEGPFNKKKKSSYLANYRYSTFGLLTEAGVDFGNEEISYNDLSFNLNFESDSGNYQFEVFGLFGTSKNVLDFLSDDEKIESDKDLQKINYDDLNFAIGSSMRKNYTGSNLKIGMLGSMHSANRDAIITLDKLTAIRDENLESDIINLSNSVIYELDYTPRMTLQVGNLIDLKRNEIKFSTLDSSGSNRNYLIDGNNFEFFNSQFLHIKFKPNKHGWYSEYGFKTTLLFSKNTLAEEVNFTNDYKNITSDEVNFFLPHVKFGYKITARQRIEVAYQLNNQNQNAFILFALPDSAPVNINLKSTKNHSYNLYYTNELKNSLVFKFQLYLQHFYDVPIAFKNNRVYSMLNNHEEIITDTLVNQGTGDNYGIDISVEKQFSNKFYALSNLSIYRSTFEDATGKTRSTKYDGKYLFNATTGYEKARKKNKNSFININARLFIQGGYRHTPIDITASAQANKTIFLESETNSLQYPDYYRMDAGIRFIKNKEKATRTWSIDIQNITNNKNVAYKYYDIFFKEIKTKYHLELIPVFNYKIEF